MAEMVKLANLVNPAVMGDWVTEHLEREMKFAPLCAIDDTLSGRAGDTVTVPKYAYIGDAGEIPEGGEIPVVQLTASSVNVQVKKALLKLHEVLDENGIEYKGCQWNPKYNGIDDYAYAKSMYLHAEPLVA